MLHASHSWYAKIKRCSQSIRSTLSHIRMLARRHFFLREYMIKLPLVTFGLKTSSSFDSHHDHCAVCVCVKHATLLKCKLNWNWMQGLTHFVCIFKQIIHRRNGNTWNSMGESARACFVYVYALAASYSWFLFAVCVCVCARFEELKTAFHKQPLQMESI